jgi:hypothetical protein
MRRPINGWTRSFGRRLAHDERGAVLVYASLALTVFMGFAALVIDGGRLFTQNTEMQSAADALALAGAAELDGSDDAVDRAKLAMDTLVQNNQTFANAARQIDGYSARFLSAIPDDSAPMSDATEIGDDPSDEVVTDQGNARFVEVTLTDDNAGLIDTMFAPAVKGSATAGTSAVAVAGYTAAVCKFTPLFMCNPYEAAGIDTFAEFKAHIQTAAERRKLIALKKPDGSDKYKPGNFGFLQTGDDDTKFREALGKTIPDACFSQTGVETHTGNIKSARVPLNTRFDLYSNGGEFKNTNAAYPPAQNVTKGYYFQGKGKADACKVDFDTTYTKALGFPLDSSFGSNRVGNGDWNGTGGPFTHYWTVNHTGVAIPAGWSDANPPSRYDVYRWEIDNNHIPNNTAPLENGNMSLSASDKRCSTHSPSTEVDRRLLYAAIVNCTANDFSGHKSGIPVVAFIKTFMTQPLTAKTCPVGTPPGQCDEDDTLYVEFIDVVSPGTDDEVVHDVVQLYR